MSSVRGWLVVVLVAAAQSQGCKCNDDSKTIPIEDGDGGTVCGPGATACTNDDQCGERGACRRDRTSGQTCCIQTFRKCSVDAECCPGQVCSSDGRCVDRYDTCTVASDCGETPDRVCKEWSDPLLGSSRRCTFERCGAGESCPEGQACFAHFCVVNPPCGGSCPLGTACVPQAAGGGRCHPFGTRCSLKPKPGALVVFSNPDAVFDTCTLADLGCEYAELPPLVSVDVGRHPSVAVVGEKLVVAQYDGHYGDLVVADHDANGKRLKAEWVDGVPLTGVVTGAPSGPRKGISDPGDDVGRFTSIAARKDGTVYVASYDGTHGDLRFAERAPDGTWTTHKIDGDGADLGYYPSLVVEPSGRPAVAYFQRAGSETSAGCATEPAAPKSLVTGLKLARATIEHPRTAADWTVEMVACAARPLPPCWGCETPGAQVCVVDETAPSKTACKPSSSACSPGCGTGQVCVAGETCAAQGLATELLDVPWGRGLYPSLGFLGADPVIAHYDRTRGNLLASVRKGSGWDLRILDGEDASGDTGHVGMFPSLAVEAGGQVHIAYHDFTRRGLRLYSGASLAPLANQRNPPASSFIDTGLSDPTADGRAWVGASASLVVAPSATWVAYQNATGVDLRLARKGATGWRLEKEWTEGALGFFAHAAAKGDGLVIVHTRLHARLASGKPTPDHELRIELAK